MELWRRRGSKMEPWRVSRTVVADSHRFDVEQDPDPHESVGSGPHLNETLVALSVRTPRIMVTPRCSTHNCIVHLRILSQPRLLYIDSPLVATTITLSSYVYCRSPASSTVCCGKHRLPAVVATTIALSAYVFCRSPAYSTECCGKHRLPAVATTIALSASVLSQPRLLYSVLWQT
jgi:hypothetical protein